ncbi:hypothetical protein ACRRTK_003757 [Alexandromys fortis]
MTLLYFLVGQGSLEQVKLLLSHKVDVDCQTASVYTPPLLAHDQQPDLCALRLVGNFPDALDHGGYSPLHMAVTKGKQLIFEMLLRYGASLELPTQQEGTPVSLATYKGHMEIIHLLDKSHADLDALGRTHGTPLHMTAFHGEEVVVVSLLQGGANPNAADQSGWTPLHLTGQKGAFLDIIHLLEHGADVHACNKVDWTAAHLAALQGNITILQVLVKANTQLDIKDGVGCTPLQMTLCSQKQGIVTFLEGKEPSLAILGVSEPGS